MGKDRAACVPCQRGERIGVRQQERDRRPACSRQGEDVRLQGYGNVVSCDLGEVTVQTQGRVLDLSLRLVGACPGSRTAVAVSVCELDPAGREYPRGLRTLLVGPDALAEDGSAELRGIRFILPEELDVCGQPGGDMGNERRIRVRAFAHPVDVNYISCVQCEGRDDARDDR